ncbi:hypothetical protein TYRP_015422 [Tyrophagus putrescentiae]|nr:hypothetical protein TYRP_015422 [Tyrophagus putrescentiae]
MLAHSEVVVADVETEWGLLKSALLEAAANVCGLTRIRVPRDGRKLTSWWSPQVKASNTGKKACFHQWLANKSPLARQRYEEAKKEANKVVAAAKASTWNKLGEKLSADYHQANKTRNFSEKAGLVEQSYVDNLVSDDWVAISKDLRFMNTTTRKEESPNPWQELK